MRITPATYYHAIFMAALNLRGVETNAPNWRVLARRLPAARGSARLRAYGGVGRYRLDGLMARFGADAALPAVLLDLAACERRADFSRPCAARFRRLRDPDDKAATQVVDSALALRALAARHGLVGGVGDGAGSDKREF
jgi:hypothetical protein